MSKSIAVVAFLLIACMLIINVNAFTDQAGNICPCATTDDLNEVCGSNGITYDNESTLDCENKCKRSRIELKHQGPC